MKKRSRKRRLNKKRVFKLILIILILFLVIYYINNIPITHIEITGNNNISDNEIIEIANIKDYPKMITTFNIESKIKWLDLVENVKIKRNLWGKLSINIREAKPLFINKDKDTIVLSNKKEIPRDDRFLGIPTLTSYVPNDIYDKLIEAFDKIDKDILNIISEIEYSPSKSSNDEVIDDTRFLLRMNDTNTVYMNTINVTQLNKYMEICSVILTTQGEKYGILYLDSSTKENYSFESYEAIKREEEAKENEEGNDENQLQSENGGNNQSTEQSTQSTTT